MPVKAVADMASSYSHPDTNHASLTIEAPPHQSSLLNIYQPPLLNTTPAYSPDSFYSNSSSLFHSLDPTRSRLVSSSTSSSGMAHAPRTATLPHPTNQLSTRDLYQGATPSFSRGRLDHTPRTATSVFAPELRRLPLSPASSPGVGFTSPSSRMDNLKGHVPPLGSLVTTGSLHYSDQNATPISVEIHGSIDKGFFLADNEWTCYRRNYFTCVCSYAISPSYQSTAVQFVPSGSSTGYTVHGYAMSISAVVADNDSHTIELVQHTPKRDKGPIAKPEKVRLSPRFYVGHDHSNHVNRGFDQGYSGSGSSLPTEHTFERIQFKQATANNGKRRAAQQYYHLCIELWADIGAQATDQFVKIAYKKSAKMIVRGRSPGHYHNERRRSTSSGPGSTGGGLGGYSGGPMNDFGGGTSLLPTSYSSSAYEPRSNYGSNRHHNLPMEPELSAQEKEAIDKPDGYQYYPGTIYEPGEPRVDVYSHHRSAHDTSGPGGPGGHSLTSGPDSKVKMDPDGSVGGGVYYQPGSAYYAKPCGRFEGKPSSIGYYPTPSIMPSAGMNMT